MSNKVVMPKMGESIVEGTIVEWKKSVGDFVSKDEILLEISTDKVDSEIPSPYEGVLTKTLFKKNDTVDVGAVIALIGNDGDTVPENERKVDSGIEDNSSKDSLDSNIESSKIEPLDKDIEKNKSQDKKTSRFYSPLVKRIAKEENISLSELESVPGSGMKGRVNKKNLLKYIEQKNKGSLSQSIKASAETEKLPKKDNFKEKHKMNHVRKVIARHMVDSLKTSPHVYSSVEVDMTNIVEFVQSSKNSFLQKYGNKLTYTPIFLEACINSLQEFPLINSSLINDEICYHENINIGLAVALPDNNLIVPVIHNAEEKNFLGLLRSASELADKAKSGTLSIESVQRSTFTLTNPGVFGSLFGMGIINQPNVAILSTGSIEKKPMVKETEFGDGVFIRSSMFLTLGYDHRIIDGAYGSKFLVSIKQYLESFNLSKEI